MSKLNPIYVALDSHQYHRAIKLASALPDTNILGKALLAHAFSKSGQRHAALVVLNKILGGNFCELKHEVEYSIEAIQERQQQQQSTQTNSAVGGGAATTAATSSTATAPEPTTASSNKKGKKGKKKGGPATAAAAAKITASAAPPTQAPAPTNAVTERDLVDQLNFPPPLPENWEVLPPTDIAITDETTLSTLSVTIQGLKLPLTAYQLYAWAATAEPPSENILTKTFCLGLNVLAAPSKWDKASLIKISTHVLAHIQAIALQWARLIVSSSQLPQQSSSFPMMLATAWAAQSSLWQLQWLPEDPKRSMLLPRLAESMAQRLMQQNEDEIQPAEVVLLSLRILEEQKKWAEMLEILDKLPTLSGDSDDGQQPLNTSTPATSEFGVSLTTYQILTEKARVLYHLEEYDKAKAVYEGLLKTSPDDWSCWKGHLECCTGSATIESTATDSFVDQILADQADAKYPLRGPYLMKVELIANRIKIEKQASPESLQKLAVAIQTYAEVFAPKASCAFSDLEVYVELLMGDTGDSSESGDDNHNNKEGLELLLQYAETLRNDNRSPEDSSSTGNNKERQTKLRAYIFAVKLNFKILSKHVDLQSRWLPKWNEIVSEWQASLSLSSSNEGEESQKELKPGDDLALLAVQQILYQNPNDLGCRVACAVLLETAINHSPDNAYLKIAAIDVYFQLNATSRSWEFFQAMSIKHIQLDSCTYIILPSLMEGGLYNETIEVCNALLRFQAGTARDCGDYAGRAMEAGTLSKANEFMVFQRNKMNKSLSVLEAKGFILDAASLLATIVPRMKHDLDPILKGGLGIHQGIVGGDDDMGRATQMIVETYNPYAALSIVSWANLGGSLTDAEDMADNRDMDILNLQLLYRTKTKDKESIVRDALRRGHIHGVLIRATLCLDAAKGPKKGKVVKPTDDLAKKTQSLLDCVETVKTFVDTHTLEDSDNGKCCKALVYTMLHICRALSVINAGLPKLDKDTLEQRESCAQKILEEEALEQLKQAKSSVVLSSAKDACQLLPNYIVPLFAVFKMCSNVCTLYGWNKRKKSTKKCAGAMAHLAEEFNTFVEKVLSCVESTLPSSETEDATVIIPEEHAKFLSESMVKDTTKLLTQAQYRTRVRVEPVLQEMNDYLHSFNVIED